MSTTLSYLPSFLELQEPKLRFHAEESLYCSANPIVGLNTWGPYDASIKGCLRPNPLRIAIIAPERSFATLIKYLERLSQEVMHTAKDEYVANWPGFRKVFQTNFEFPAKSDNPLVQTVPETAAEEARRSPHPEVAFLETLKKHIRVLLPVRHEFDVLLIHIPDRWKEFREKRDVDYEFDLHDALKVFSAPNNLAIQILEEDSFRYPDQARIMWWLALALYVKGKGIPWKLAEPSTDTAFVGLSYGVSNKVGSRRIIMGCSQVFDENGEGLKFLLHPVESPVFHGRNPYMSREDARRLFGRIREIYQSINNKKPTRVVVHKTTHFTSDEMSGIAAALAGVEEIELLQIQQDTHWRAIAFDPFKKTAGMFPVKRGTVMPLDRFGFLLWTQGDMLGVARANRHFYQEQRGIPSPLIVRRFRGKGSLEQVATDILKLTKMNWNNHQLYSRLPVTIKFSDELAQVAKQIEGAWSNFYDFRFFM